MQGLEGEPGARLESAAVLGSPKKETLQRLNPFLHILVSDCSSILLSFTSAEISIDEAEPVLCSALALNFRPRGEAEETE